MVAHELGNVTIMECMRYAVHGDDDDLFEQNITMTIVRLQDDDEGQHIIVYHPIPLSRVQMRQHVLSEAPGVQYWIVLPCMFHHLFVDEYLALLPREGRPCWQTTA